MKKKLLLFSLALIAWCGMRGEHRQTLVLHKDNIMLPDSSTVNQTAIGNDFVYKIGHLIKVDSLLLGEDINKVNNRGSFTIRVSSDTIRTFKCKRAIGPGEGLKSLSFGAKDTISIEWSCGAEYLNWFFVCATQNIVSGGNINAKTVDVGVDDEDKDDDDDGKGGGINLSMGILLILLLLGILGGMYFWIMKYRKGSPKAEKGEHKPAKNDLGSVENSFETEEQIESVNDLTGRKYVLDHSKKTKKTRVVLINNDTNEQIRLKEGKEFNYNIQNGNGVVTLGNLSEKANHVSLPFTICVMFLDKRGDIVQKKYYPYKSSNQGMSTGKEPIDSCPVEGENIKMDGAEHEVTKAPEEKIVTLTQLANWLNTQEEIHTEEEIHIKISDLIKQNLELENLIGAIGKRLGVDLSRQNDLLTINERELARAIDSQKQSDIRRIWNEANGNVTSFLYKIQQLIEKSSNNGIVPTPSISSFDEISPLLTGKFVLEFKTYVKKFLLDKGVLRNQGFSNRTLDDLINALVEQERIIKDGQQQGMSLDRQQEIAEDAIEQLVKTLNDKIDENEKKVTRGNFIELCSAAINAPNSADEIEKKAVELAEGKVKKAEMAISKAEGQVEVLKEQLKEATEKVANSKETYSRNIDNLKEQHQLALQEQETKLVKEKEDLEIKLRAEKNDLEVKLIKEKDELEAKLLKEKEDVREMLNTEKDNHRHDLQKLRDYLEEYIKGIRTTFDLVSESLKHANNGNDAMMKKIVSDIVENRTYSLDYFDEKLQGVLKDAESTENLKSVEEVKVALGVVFEDCLKEDDPTWLDVLVRFYSYTQVRFLSDKLADLGIDISRVVTAFQSTVVLLHQFGIEIDYPKLFVDNYDSERHDQKQVLNILSYLPGIENDIREQAGDNEKLIVDLRTVGYRVNGVLKEKPVVAKFY